MPSRLLVLLAVVLVGPRVSPAVAQDAPLQVAVVDVQRVLTESQPGRQRTASLEAEQQRLQAQGERLQQEAQRIQSRIAELEGSQAEAELASLRQELQQKTTELSQFAEQARRDLAKRQETVLREIEQIVMPVIQAIGDERRLTLIFRKFDSGLIYTVPSVDITDDVIARIDAESAGSSP